MFAHKRRWVKIIELTSTHSYYMKTIKPIQTLLQTSPNPSDPELKALGYRRAMTRFTEPHHKSTHIGSTITSGFKVRSICVRRLDHFSPTFALLECPGCHNPYFGHISNIFCKRTVTCGCKRTRRAEPAGEVYGELTILRRVDTDRSGTVNVLVRCPKGHEGKRKYSRLKRMGPRAACTVCHPYQGPGFQLPTV